MNTKKLILEAYDKGIRLTLKDDSLVAVSTGEKMDVELRARIKEHREEIIAYLKAQTRHEVALDSAFTAIPVAAQQESYPVPTSLFRVWVLSQFAQGNIAYNMPGAVGFKGFFSVEVLENAFRFLIARHEILRTVFKENESGEVRQYILPVETSGFRVGYSDFSALPQREEQLKQIMADLVVQPFDLATGPLLRAHVFRMGEEEHVFFFNMHHIINDGWSMEVFINEIFHLYNALYSGTGIDLEPLRIQYKDYTIWQQQLRGAQLEVHRNYWLQQFAGEIPVLALPGDYVRPAVQTYNGAIVRAAWSREMTAALNTFVKAQDGTPFMGLLSAVYALLYRYTAQEDIVIGSPTAGRTHADLENQLGFYVNTLALRARFNGDDHFLALFRHVKEITLAAFDHQVYPFGDLVDELKPARDISRSPLFDVMLVLHNNEVKGPAETKLGNLEAHHYTTDYVTSKFDLSFYFKEVDGEMKVSIEYNTDIFSHRQMNSMLVHLERLLALLIENPATRVAVADYLTTEEKQRQLVAAKEITDELLLNQTIPGLFQQQVLARPDSIALCEGDCTITYRQLNQASDQIAAFLLNQYQLQQEALVGVMLPLGAQYVTAIMGILKAGGAYVPIEVSFPFQRVKGIIEDAQIGLLVTRNEYNETADHLQWECNTQPRYLTLDNNNRFNEMPAETETESQQLWDYVAKESEEDIIKAGGWIDSYSGAPFTAAEMEEFSENVRKKLEGYIDGSKKVLEVGCGSGLILRKIAPHVALYAATDISPVLVDKLSRYASETGMDNLVPRCLSAAQLHALDLGQFDIIILNSVVQYFPGHGYLRKVIAQCLELLTENGVLFIGDVMDLDSRSVLVEEHIAYKKAHPAAPTKLDFSTELFLSRAYFEQLATQEAVDTITASAKYGTLQNELTRHRYDVLINKRPGKGSTIKGNARYYQSDIEGQPTGYNSPVISRNELAYVTYTSGSTGRPKGVMITHGNVVAFLASYGSVFHMLPGMRVGALTNISFDIAVLELIGTLCLGMEVVFLPGNDPVQLAAAIRNSPVDVLQLTPSRLQQLLFCSDTLQQDMQAVKVLLVGGEALSEGLYDWLRTLTHTHVLNVYGPTETTVWSSALAIPGSTALSVGKPLPGEQLYVLDKAGNLVPEGVAGEIFIGGAGVGRGYLGRPELTAARFINHPYHPLEKIYATGDAGRWLPDGNMAFAGRKDTQVKVRGYRVEPGEVESILLTHPLVKAAIVIAVKNEQSENELAAFVVTGQAIEEAALYALLETLLPAYMIPSRFIQLASFPLLPSGKTDRKQLEEMCTVTVAEERICVPPRHATDVQLQLFWSEVLGKKAAQISIDDNFFHLGGHSLKATRLMSMINKAFNVGLLLNDLFSQVTIAAQSDFIALAKEQVFERIPVLPLQESYLLSSPQLRLWVLSQFEAGNIAYNMPGVFCIRGELDEALFQASFNRLIERHEILRTVFREENGEARQVVQSATQHKFRIALHDWREEAGAVALMEADIEQRKTAPFNLKTGPLLKACLYRLEEKQYVFFFNMHHIISDGWSMEVFMREIMVVYNALKSGQPVQLPALPVQYKDYASWQRAQLKEELLLQHRGYWMQQFAGELPVLDMPEDKARPELMTYQGAEVKGNINAATAARLQALLHEKGATLFMGLLAGVNAVFNRYTGAEDIVIGTPLAGRQHADLENQIGFYINTLALRTRFKGTDNFHQLLDNVKAVTLGAYDHQVYPFDQLIDDLKVNRNLSRSPLFNVMVILQNNDSFTGEMRFDQFTVSTYESATRTSKFDLSFIFTESESGIDFIIEYNTDIYSQEQTDLLALHYSALMESITANAQAAIDSVDYLTPEESNLLTESGNHTGRAYDHTQTVVTLIEQQAASMPQKTALLFADTAWSYEQLNAAANQLAGWLKASYGIAANDLVAIQLERTPWMLIAQLGVLKAGAAYVPIDPEFPEDRINYIIDDSKCRVCIDAQLLAQFHLQQQQFSVTDAVLKPAPGNLAYVIYTSGSTGRPKGVMIEHRSLTSFIQNLEPVFNLTPQSTMCASTNCTFDISVLELLGTLAIGATCYLLNEKDPLEMLALISHRKIDALQLTPSRLRQLFAADAKALQTLARLEVLLVGGEALSTVLHESLTRLQHTRVVNVYGPTETTIWSSCQVLAAGKPVSIGRPLLNERIYILDKYKKPVPVRVNGDLYIGGQGLARGYHNSPDMTAQKFMADPFVTGASMYATGDTGRRLPNGEIAFTGRTDDQVKVRGYRIETGEVERAVLTCEGIQSCFITIIKDADGVNELVAYIVSREVISVKNIRRQLGSILPHYMIPAFFVTLEQLPLTSSGKVNTKALPAPAERHLFAEEAMVVAESRQEKILVSIWSDVLNIDEDEISVHANFFDIGGNSINAIRLVAQVNDQFQVNLPLISLFQHATIASLNEAIVQAGKPLLPDGALCMQPEGEGSPLFLVAGTGGFVMGFYPLVQALEETCTIYGLEPRGIEGDVAPLATVEELAAYYIKAVRHIQPAGPYRLLGHSFGAYVVYEMAAQLQALGQQVSLLFLFDTGAPLHTPVQQPVMTREELKLGLLHTMQQHFEWAEPVADTAYLQLEETQQHEWLQQRLVHEGLDLTLDQIRGYTNVFIAQGATRYYPDHCLNDTQIVLFKTSEMDAYIQERGAESLGWEQLSRQQPKVHDVPGNHITMLRKEHIAPVAACLKEYLLQEKSHTRVQNQETFI